jgi:hypothetical protein
VIAWVGNVGEGVLGPREDGAEVKDDCDSAWDPFEEAMELTRGEDVPGEYACPGGRDASEGNLSPGMYDGRAKGSEKGTLSWPRVCTCEIDGRSSFTVQKRTLHGWRCCSSRAQGQFFQSQALGADTAKANGQR